MIYPSRNFFVLSHVLCFHFCMAKSVEFESSFYKEFLQVNEILIQFKTNDYSMDKL